MARTAGDCEAAEMILAMERTMRHIGDRLGIAPGDVVALVDRVEALLTAESRLGEQQKYWDDEKIRYDAVDKAFRQVCDERDALSHRLDNALEALRTIDRSDPRYDANEVHHAARYGMGWAWDVHRQVWLNEKGEDMVRGRDYGFAVERLNTSTGENK
jgi:hypothetical protein